MNEWNPKEKNKEKCTKSISQSNYWKSVLKKNIFKTMKAKRYITYKKNKNKEVCKIQYYNKTKINLEFYSLSGLFTAARMILLEQKSEALQWLPFPLQRKGNSLKAMHNLAASFSDLLCNFYSPDSIQATSPPCLLSLKHARHISPLTPGLISTWNALPLNHFRSHSPPVGSCVALLSLSLTIHLEFPPPQHSWFPSLRNISP